MRCFRLAAMGCVVIAASVAPVHGALVEYTFGGVITAASNAAAGGSPAWSPPSPFTAVQVGQTWSLRYVFESEAARTGTNPALFNGAIRQMTLTIGGASTSLPASPPGGFAPLGAIALTSAPTLHQYDSSIPLSVVGGTISAGVVLQDSSRTAITDFTRLPLALSLSSFNTSFFFLGPLNAQNQYRGTITSFVPAPSTMAGLLGAAALATVRRRR